MSGDPVWGDSGTPAWPDPENPENPENPINEFQEAEFLDSDAWDGVGEFDVALYGDVMLDAIQRARSYHPQWTLGRLMGHAACIARGQLNVSPTSLLDSELLAGLKALVPDAWEIQEDSEAEARRLARELRGGAGRGAVGRVG